MGGRSKARIDEPSHDAGSTEHHVFFAFTAVDFDALAGQGELQHTRRIERALGRQDFVEEMRNGPARRDRALIDGDNLTPPERSRSVRARHKTAELCSCAGERCVNSERVDVAPQLTDGPYDVAAALRAHRLCLGDVAGERDVRVTQRIAARHVCDALELDMGLAPKGAPVWTGVEKPFDGDGGAWSARTGAQILELAGGEADLGRVHVVAPPADGTDGRNGGECRQCLTAEAQRRDTDGVVGVLELAGGVPLERQDKLVGGHPTAVVAYLNGALADRYPDMPRPSVDGVVEQLAHDGCGAINGRSRGELGRCQRVECVHGMLANRTFVLF